MIKIEEKANVINNISASLLDTWLAPLMPYLNKPGALEVNAVRFGEVLVETAGGYTAYSDPAFTAQYWSLLCHALAHGSGVHFDEVRQPKLSVMLPQGHRFEAMLGCAQVASGLSVSIRLKRDVKLELSQFGLNQELAQRLESMLSVGSNIVISGGTSSGKTTFLNQVVHAIPPTKRVLVVEDTRELHVPHSNASYFLVPRSKGHTVVDYPGMIDHLMRSRPDIIIMGELSMANAYPIIRLLNSGHAGFLCTLHANSPQLALSWAIPQNISFDGHNIDARRVNDFLNDTVDLVIQLHRDDDGRRHVSELWFPKTGEHIHLTSTPPAHEVPHVA